MDLNIGDLLYRSKGIVQHVGVFLGGNKVLHNSPDCNTAIVSLEKFSADKPIKVVRRSIKEPEFFKQRIDYALTIEKTYNPFSYNCEQLATYVVEGNSQSKQIVGTVIGSAIGLIVDRVFNLKSPVLSMAAGGIAGCAVINKQRQYDSKVHV
ncbi:hypothetical protein D5R81_03915 [Parashewanella spongiae]|uniref:LRAT domain-containing protein n=1 Tax=Parashewanella spongiae TaxID=342950 RepID=A0A3A6TZZ3_9GAMM|nr:hypothetical protein [Parashewanella spongiae]MCL1077042.1 C40 family peptidase [Parashewanella spongiae]RJY18744.1 hypothetical protein D5R81_03915 [Parashewanella spongiae]